LKFQLVRSSFEPVLKLSGRQQSCKPPAHTRFFTLYSGLFQQLLWVGHIRLLVTA
jgi:hypothetical protein